MLYSVQPVKQQVYYKNKEFQTFIKAQQVFNANLSVSTQP